MDILTKTREHLFSGRKALFTRLSHPVKSYYIVIAQLFYPCNFTVSGPIAVIQKVASSLLSAAHYTGCQRSLSTCLKWLAGSFSKNVLQMHPFLYVKFCSQDHIGKELEL